MKTKQEFIERWRKHVAGLALFGLVSDLRDGTLVKASKALDIPDEVEKLLGAMHDYMAAEAKNGTPPAPVKRTT